MATSDKTIYFVFFSLTGRRTACLFIKREFYFDLSMEIHRLLSTKKMHFLLFHQVRDKQLSSARNKAYLKVHKSILKMH